MDTDLQIDSNGMLVDEAEYFNGDRPDVAIITPDSSIDEPESEPLADDFESMKTRVLPQIPDLETEAEAYYTWPIRDWRRMQRREHSPVFQCGGIPWRVLFFPFGNNVEHASFYLEHGFEKKPPEDWYACVQFALVLWNPEDPSIYVQHTANHRFNADEGDWGFTRFCELRRLFHQQWEDKQRSLVEGDAAQLTAYVRIVKDPTGVLWHNFVNYDSKKETGLVGLKNQGATCYLNSLLQSLYFTNSFRKAVFQIPTESEQAKSNSAWTLQRLFYLLQTSNNAVSTQELTASFGWDTRQIFEQQDVQELSRVLMERLETRMKGGEFENALPELFRGRSRTNLACINVDFESNKKEEFWDISLNIRKNKTLDDSFRDYLQSETMEGDNKYDAGPPYGLQDARTRIIFETFPPVLHLQLKRFEFDVDRLQMVKLNDRHEFPEEFDASPYLSDEADRSESWVYQLQGVLVHSGDVNAGHYYAFLRPGKEGPFYKFDDDRVTRATMKETLEENFGGEYANLPNGTVGVRQPYARGYSTKRSMNAYMLVYIRKSRLDSILGDVGKDDIPSHIERKLAEEKAELERRRKEREEQHLYLIVYLITEANFKKHHTFDLATWEDNPQEPSAPKKYRILRAMKVSQFAEQIAEEHELGEDQVRFWVMVNRQNKTTRPDQPLSDPNLTIEEAYNRYATKGNNCLRLWAEFSDQETGKVEWPLARPQDNNNPILIFLKYFDLEAQSLTGVGHTYVKKHQKVADLAAHVLEVMNWPAGTQFMLYEEIKFSMIESMKPKQTFQQSEIQDGDIVCFQKTPLDKTDVPTGGYADAREYYDYLLNRVHIRFMLLQKEKEADDGDFTLTLSRKMTYEQFSAKVAEYLKVDPTHLRFSTMYQNLKAKANVKRTLNQSLYQILNPNTGGYAYTTNQRNDSLYYEILEQSLSEYETKKLLKVIWLTDGIAKEDVFQLLVPKNGVIADLFPLIQKKANLDDDAINNIRIYEAHAGKIYKELDDNFSVAGVNEFVVLYAEILPEEERNASEGDRSIYAFHFDKEPNKTHGVPFKFVVKPGELFKDTKDRLSKRTGIKGKQFEKMKFSVVHRTAYHKPTVLEDDDILYELANETDDLLGLDHVNKTRSFWNRGDSIFIR